MSDIKTNSESEVVIKFASDRFRLPSEIQGWVKVTANSADPVRVYFAYDKFKHQIFIYEAGVDDDGYLASDIEPSDIIWLSACTHTKHEYSTQMLSFVYDLTGVAYVFYEDDTNVTNQSSKISRLIGFISSWNHSNIYADVGEAQNFYRLVSNMSKTVQQQTRQLSKISEFTHEFSVAEAAFEKDTNLLKSKKLKNFEKSLLEQAQKLRRRFWEYLNQTTQMMCDKHTTALLIINYLKRLEPIFENEGKSLSVKDKEIIIKFSEKISDFVSFSKQKEMNKLANKWLQLRNDFNNKKFLKGMKRVRCKYNKKALESIKNRNIGIYVGIVAGVIAGIAAICLCFAATPVVIATMAVAGVIAVCAGGYALYKHVKGVECKAIAESFSVDENIDNATDVGNRIIMTINLDVVMNLRAELIAMNKCVDGDRSEFIEELLNLQYERVKNLERNFENFCTECKNAYNALRQMYRKYALIV